MLVMMLARNLEVPKSLPFSSGVQQPAPTPAPASPPRSADIPCDVCRVAFPPRQTSLRFHRRISGDDVISVLSLCPRCEGTESTNLLPPPDAAASSPIDDGDITDVEDVDEPLDLRVFSTAAPIEKPEVNKDDVDVPRESNEEPLDLSVASRGYRLAPPQPKPRGSAKRKRDLERPPISSPSPSKTAAATRLRPVSPPDLGPLSTNQLTKSCFAQIKNISPVKKPSRVGGAESVNDFGVEKKSWDIHRGPRVESLSKGVGRKDALKDAVAKLAQRFEGERTFPSAQPRKTPTIRTPPLSIEVHHRLDECPSTSAASAAINDAVTEAAATSSSPNLTEPGADPAAKSRRRFHCHLCDKVYLQKQSLKVHVQCVHEMRGFPCHVCHKMFPRVDQLEEHRNEVHLKIKLVCPFCLKTFKRSRHIRTHYQQAHGVTAKQVEALMQAHGNAINASE